MKRRTTKECKLARGSAEMARKARDDIWQDVSDWLEPSVIKSPDQIADVFDAIERRCRSSVDILVQGALPLATGNAAEERVLRRGVRVRCIYERSLASSPDGKSYLKRWSELGEDQRVVESVPLRAAVIDRSIVLVPVESEAQVITSLLVVRAGLGEAIAHLFDLLWEGRPVLTQMAQLPRPLTEQELAILKLMCDGAGDRKISRDLNISNRTVQRRLQEMSALLGADSRAALAARAVALGLVTPFDN